MVDDMEQFIDSYGCPCYHAETVVTVEVPQFQFIARAGGRSSSQQMDSRLSALAGLAAMKGGLLQFCGIFLPPSIWTLRPRVAGTPGV